MKAAIFCGSRNISGKESEKLAARIMNHYLRDSSENDPHVVIEGEARGADTLFAVAAQRSGMAKVERFPAHWNDEGKKAGILRNDRMAKRLSEYRDKGYEVHCIALVPQEITRGTGNMVDTCHQLGITTTVFKLDGTFQVV